MARFGAIGGTLFAVVVLLGVFFTGCTKVDQTDYCIETRFGKVVNEHMSTGMALTIFSEATCFPLTDVNYPNQGSTEQIDAQTADPVTVQGDVGVVYAYDPASVNGVFIAKRTPAAAEIEILNAIREGYRTALAGWTVQDIFSIRRTALSDSVQAHIQRKLGTLATIKRAYVRDIRIPKTIEDARIGAVAQAQVLDSTLKRFAIDSVAARATIIRAQAEAEATRLRGNAYAGNPALLELERAKAFSEAIARACSGPQITTCVIGGTVLDANTRRP
jgi:regulator of protease activity HflC (stomatin/prohibitin superfamily)